MVSRTRITALAVLAAAAVLATGCGASSKNSGGTAPQNAPLGKQGQPNAPSPAPPARPRTTAGC